MNSKTYTLPNGKKAVFEYDVCGIGKVTLECMDELMAMIADRPQGEWIPNSPFTGKCSECGADGNLKDNYCSNCGARMFAKDINVPNKKGADDGADNI